MELGWKYLTEDDKQRIIEGVRDGVAYGGPYHVEIHPADRCNIDCFFCSTAALRGTDELSLTRLERRPARLVRAHRVRTGCPFLQAAQLTAPGFLVAARPGIRGG